MSMPLDKALDELEQEIYRHEGSIAACREANVEVYDLQPELVEAALKPRVERLEALYQMQRVGLMVWQHRDEIRQLLKKNNGAGEGDHGDGND